jgi:hypothetical protein
MKLPETQKLYGAALILLPILQIPVILLDSSYRYSAWVPAGILAFVASLVLAHLVIRDPQVISYKKYPPLSEVILLGFFVQMLISNFQFQNGWFAISGSFLLVASLAVQFWRSWRAVREECTSTPVQGEISLMD